jgi:hypothetical protein
MRRTLITGLFITGLAAIILVGGTRAASATEVGYSRKFGLGFVLGDPTGLSAKYWVGPTNSLDFGLGFYGYGVSDRCGPNCGRLNGYSNGTFNIDYLWQSNIVRGTAQLDWHIGPGGRALWYGNCGGDCFTLAARMPVGLDLMFANPSFVELFAEVAPTFYLLAGWGPEIEGGLGARFYF